MDKKNLSDQIKRWGYELGFQQTGITTIAELKEDETHLLHWLRKGYHGEMEYMALHGTKRSRPDALLPGTVSVISVRMDYFPSSGRHPLKVLHDKQTAYISRYALGRDYHKLIRRRLQKLANRIEEHCGKFGYRCFVDSAPILEKALARNASLGWIGKHSNLINPKAGSWFFLGEICTNLPLEEDIKCNGNYCGTCNACIDICPTRAIVAPMQVDARRCISYLTIELKNSIPVEFRKMIGNRVYGCDDCQLICPWNKFVKNTREEHFQIKNGLDSPALIDLFKWSEEVFLKKMEGSAIRRIGYDRWSRNIAVGLGNAITTDAIINVLLSRKNDSSEMVREHVMWALEQHSQ